MPFVPSIRQNLIDPIMTIAATKRKLCELFARYDMKTKRPNKHTARVAWNEHFELTIGFKYDLYDVYLSDPPQLFENNLEKEWLWKALDFADVVQEAAQLTKEIMALEGRLIALAAENIIWGSFEADWSALNMEKKREIVLEGLYRGACVAPRDNSRDTCPEMTVAGLAGDGEYNLINLLKRPIVYDPMLAGSGRVKETFLFSHPYVDHTTQHTEGAPTRHGHPLEKTRPAKTHGNQHCTEQFKIEMKTYKAKHGLIVDNSKYKEDAAIAAYTYYFYLEWMDNRDSLKRCAACKGPYYCSKECQRADWKTHKKYCGKRHFDPKVLAPEIEAPGFIGCPAVVQGFSRSPALWRQIGRLAEGDSQGRDYHFMPDMNVNHTLSIRILCPRARSYFLVARRRALASGSLPAIYKMLEIIKSQIEHCNLTIEQVQRHFEHEYGIKMDATPAAIISAVKGFEEPTEQELEEERLFDEQREASVPFRPEDWEEV
ncbi:hypothetical protein K438DRAFT_1965467 [Mycena galopus ATCC 62051]|nr:hypothetical protein K438DRAFT_1965467 [Mycena galopus ATCC 62051]